MIDKNFKESDLSLSKKLAAKWISNPIIDVDGSGVNTITVKSIYVILKDSSVYLNSDLVAITEFADRNNTNVTVVMENGKVLSDSLETIEEEITETPVVEVKKKKRNN